MTILEVKSLKKIYTTRFGGNQVQALSNVSFSVEQGEYVAIMGESGSGKTTLLNILAALDKPTSGEVYLDGKCLTNIREKEISAFRRDNLGFVFQDFNLLDTFSIQDNIFFAAGTGEKGLPGDAGAPCADCEKAGNYGYPAKVPVRGIRRAEAADGGSACPDYRAETDSGGRADWGARLACDGRPAADI